MKRPNDCQCRNFISMLKRLALWLTPTSTAMSPGTVDGLCVVRLNQFKINQTGHFTIWHIAHCTGAHTHPNMRSNNFSALQRLSILYTCESDLSNGNSRLPLLISNYMYINDLSWWWLVVVVVEWPVLCFIYTKCKVTVLFFFCDTSAAHSQKQKLHKWKFTRIHFQLKPIPAMLHGKKK